MTYDSLVNAAGAFLHRPLTGSDESEVPRLKAGYENSLDPKTIREIGRKYKKYKRLEDKTGVPWKVIAAIDQATGYPLGIAARKVKAYGDSLNRPLTPASEERDVLDLVNVLKKKYPDKLQLFEAFLAHYQRINGAFN